MNHDLVGGPYGCWQRAERIAFFQQHVALETLYLTDGVGVDPAQDGRFWQTDLDRAAAAPKPELREGLVPTFPPRRPGWWRHGTS